MGVTVKDCDLTGEFCEILGIDRDKQKVSRVLIDSGNLNMGGLVTATIVSVISHDQADLIAKVIARYRLVEMDDGR
jgi:hypothetical protein